MYQALLLVSPLMVSIVVYLCIKRWVWPDVSAVFKLKLKRIWNFIIGITLMIVFFTADFCIAFVPALIIKPHSIFSYMVSIIAFLVIFLFVLFVTVFLMSKRADSLNDKIK
jgi:hypothetical protein